MWIGSRSRAEKYSSGFRERTARGYVLLGLVVFTFDNFFVDSPCRSNQAFESFEAYLSANILILIKPGNIRRYAAHGEVDYGENSPPRATDRRATRSQTRQVENLAGQTAQLSIAPPTQQGSSTSQSEGYVTLYQDNKKKKWYFEDARRKPAYVDEVKEVRTRDGLIHTFTHKGTQYRARLQWGDWPKVIGLDGYLSIRYMRIAGWVGAQVFRALVESQVTTSQACSSLLGVQGVACMFKKMKISTAAGSF